MTDDGKQHSEHVTLYNRNQHVIITCGQSDMCAHHLAPCIEISQMKSGAMLERRFLAKRYDTFPATGMWTRKYYCVK